MTRKDIALTVGGILATMSLAYLFYALQKRDAAAAAQASSDAAAVADQATADQSGQYYQEAAYYGGGQQFPSISIPDFSSQVSSSGATATTGTTGTSIDATDASNLISQIIADYAGNTGSNPNLLPTITNTDPIAAAVANIPISAQQATQTPGTGDSGTYYAPGGSGPGYQPSPNSPTVGILSAQQSNSGVTSHPVTAHPIVTTGT
jgi:hypothetical protein